MGLSRSLRRTANKALAPFSLELRKIRAPESGAAPPSPEPLAVDPVWPLPRRADGPGDDEIRQRFATYDSVLYGYDFEGGLSLEAHSEIPGPYLAEGRD
jgi:hypothetical protein